MKLQLVGGETWQPVKVEMSTSYGTVLVEMDQPYSADGKRLCCCCKRLITSAEAVSADGVTASVLLLFCSAKCASHHA